MYNYQDLTDPRNIGSGVADRFLFAPVAAFASGGIQTPTLPAANPGDEVIITKSHQFLANEGFVQINTAPFYNRVQAVGVGEPSSMTLTQTLEVFIPGSYAEQHEYMKNGMNTPAIVLIRDANCDAGFYYQLGSNCQSCWMTAVEFDTGDTLSGRKGWKVTFTYVNRTVYLYTGTPYIKGVDYGSGLLWSAGNPLQYAVGEPLNYSI